MNMCLLITIPLFKYCLLRRNENETHFLISQDRYKVDMIKSSVLRPYYSIEDPINTTETNGFQSEHS